MNEESRIEALEHELKILKNEIQSTLLEIREQILNHYYPELRAEEPPQINSRSLPVRQQVGRPGLPAKSAPRPQEEPSSLSEIEAKGQVLPFSDIFLEDLSDDNSDIATNELVNSRRPSADLDDELEEDDDDFEDLLADILPHEAENEPSNGNDHAAGKIKVQKVVPSSNAFGRAPQTREVDFRQLKQGGTGNKPAVTPAPERAERHSEPKAETPVAKTKRPNFAALATWVNDGVTKVGKERTTQIVETYATGGKLSSETKSSLLQLISLAEEEATTPAVGSQEMLGLMVGLDQILR